MKIFRKGRYKNSVPFSITSFFFQPAFFAVVQPYGSIAN